MTDSKKNSNRTKAKWDLITIITVIFIINIIYLLFSCIQFSYLYAEASKLPNGLSHAEYARKGFFELVFITLINLAILCSSIKLCRHSNSKITKLANISYTLLIAFTFNMLISANYKMKLYENMFGYTRLRLFVQTFMFLLAFILLITLLGIWINKIPIFKISIIASLVFYLALNFMNIDKIIAKNNIDRYKDTNIIDINYLETLSYDATGEIKKLLNSEDPKIKNSTFEYLNTQYKRITNHYNRWFEYNYYKEQILDNPILGHDKK